MKSIAVNIVSVDWPAAVGTAPDPPEAADARACANAVLPAPVGPTTAIALTTFADLLAAMSAHLPWKRAAPSAASKRRAPLLAYIGLSRPDAYCFTTASNVKRRTQAPPRFLSSSNTRPMNDQ